MHMLVCLQSTRLLFVLQPLPLGAEGLSLRSGCDELCEVRRDALERDERRLAELGRRSVELYALTHIFTEQLEVSMGGGWPGAEGLRLLRSPQHWLVHHTCCM
jgi:hypothetical protein